jgi:sugar phosphate permease
MATWLGWRSAFRLYGVLGFAFSVVWAAVASPAPESCSYCQPDERAFLAKTVTVTAPAAAKPRLKSRARRAAAPPPPAQRSWAAATGRRLSSPSVWCIFVSHMSFNFCVFFMTSWGPYFYQESFGMRPEDAKLALSLPPLINIAIKLVLNSLEGLLRARLRLSTLQCRRFFTVTGFCGGSLALLFLPAASARGGSAGATACFVLANAFLALHPAGFKANYMDVTRGSAGAVTGIGNTLASLASFAGSNLVAYFLHRYGSWTPVSAVLAMMQLLAGAGFLFFSTTTPVD